LQRLLNGLYARAMTSSLYKRKALMTIQCPSCQSASVMTKDIAKKIGALIGTVGGAAQRVTGAMAGVEVGAIVGIVAGPPGVAVGGIAGAILGGLAGAATGCIAGAKLGEIVDERVLDNYHCLDCGLSFSCRHSA
ncbi:hypothetical protein, partial [Pseudomonas savastanoi]|uniref:hypothetical protein n=1 Tax=Pseudomonas savastanoi TaxID=29438 RepID=UPI0035C7956C